MDELEKRVRAARPLSGHRDLPLTDRAKRELADLMLSAVPPDSAQRTARRSRRRRARQVTGSTAIAASLVVLGIITAAPMLSPEPAYAATPELLSVHPVPGTTFELLTDLRHRLDETPTGDQPANFTINVEAWTLQSDDDGAATGSTVAPEKYHITRDADGAYSTRVTAGQAVDSAGQPIVERTSPGALIWEESWNPGDYQFLYTSSAPESADLISSYFSDALDTPEPLSAASAIQATNDLLFEQRLSATQLSALLEYFAQQSDLSVLGEVSDRLGRTGVVLAAVDPQSPDYERRLIVSPETGSILATETVYTGTDRTDIPSPSVVNYFVWK